MSSNNFWNNLSTNRYSATLLINPPPPHPSPNPHPLHFIGIQVSIVFLHITVLPCHTITYSFNCQRSFSSFSIINNVETVTLLSWLKKSSYGLISAMKVVVRIRVVYIQWKMT